MHRSRLTTIVIDCADDDFERGVSFWSQALGKQAIDQDGPRYKSLRGRIGGEGGPYVLLQRVSKPERAIHLDIETDDVEQGGRAAREAGRAREGADPESRRDDGALGPSLLRGAGPPRRLPGKRERSGRTSSGLRSPSARCALRLLALRLRRR